MVLVLVLGPNRLELEWALERAPVQPLPMPVPVPSLAGWLALVAVVAVSVERPLPVPVPVPMVRVARGSAGSSGCRVLALVPVPPLAG